MAQPTGPVFPNSLEEIPGVLSIWVGNFQRNLTKAVIERDTRDYIRLVIIVGAYALLRPYAMKFLGKLQMKQHEREGARTAAAIHPNELRGVSREPKIALPGLDSDDEAEEEEYETVAKSTAGDWGKGARMKQRKMIRDKLEEHERRLREMKEEEDDKDIQEFLVD